MNIQIIPEDRLVSVDGEAYSGIDLSWLGSTVHAIRWSGTSGEVEIKDSSGALVENRKITSFDPYTYAVSQWRVRKEEVRRESEPVITASVVSDIMTKDSDMLYFRVVGNRAQEYLLAEQEAAAFKDSGYVGTPGPAVRSWAIAANLPDRLAADTILQQAAGMRAAQYAVREKRLELRYQKLNAGVSPEVVLAEWRSFIAVIRQQLGV